MARYILIDNHSGFIFGDSADLDGKIFTGTPMEYAAALDASIGEHNHTYERGHHHPASNRSGYFVYRADIDGSDAVPVVRDGQDPEMIDAVERECKLLGFMICTSGP
jgi:hypothetical protein